MRESCNITVPQSLEKTYRTKEELMEDILKPLEGTNYMKTKLMYRADCGSKQFDKYFPYIESKGLIKVEVIEGQKWVSITDKGREFLQYRSKINRLLA
jgi:predicted transcriptional regulator